MSRILGIETSCDETGVAVIEDGRRMIVNLVASQVDIHARFGGVVPEIASRQHTHCIGQLTREALAEAGDRPDAVAVTQGPGLMGSLLVGVNFAKALAYAWRVPLVPVHHIEGHIFSAFLGQDPPDFPFLALVVSGGHTCLIDSPRPHEYIVLGATRDDAIGECFDKVARLLGLSYPGGPSIQKEAEGGDPLAYDFPRGLAKSDTLEFSYSGLKTAALYAWRKGGVNVQDLAASFQHAAVDTLLIKTRIALAQTRARRLVLAGGVAANRLLRDRLRAELDVDLFMPPLSLCVDNGAMIAAAGHSRWLHGGAGSMRVTPFPNMPLPSCR
ncbi:MAG TPA: tRNA (adenosine(37)-N6)-threonylcarbamoyltransferase complex transferase subunit TsaD [Candidatus Hydrogenedentes bacterium]|nr:tRNA (adenosine(37)-N6)-threonylcarbamoyltransferase complex transferase subunit TsaD [Candidatus Hydrogenedentota bacterium]HOS01778.1 tRNA (adenosine(37)-N6)-threonylcarbamoyltransferase complex transferase subunit TsaD [Candidatus Hydrogenedentota bacterium]